MALTDVAIRKAQKAERAYKLTDSGGLHILVATSGHKSWRFRYRSEGKEQLLVFGSYPDVTLSAARKRRDKVREQIQAGIDPAIEKIREKAARLAAAENTFEAVARRWHARELERWSPRYGRLVMFALERDIFPKFGRLPIKEITSPIVLTALRSIEARGARETAHRIRQQVSGVFVFGIAEGIVEIDVSATLAKALLPVPKAQKFPAITDLGDLSRFVKTLDQSVTVGSVVKCASRLLALTAVRPGIIAGALWTEFEGIRWNEDFIGPERPIWRIPAERMKLDAGKKANTAFDHILPLSMQAVQVLKAVRSETGRSPFVFPNSRTWRRPLSGDAIRMAYRRQGYGDRHVPHGWRATFSTIMNQRARRQKRFEDREVIDLMLSHVPEGVSASELQYNRMEHLADCHRIAQEWADILLAGQCPADHLLGVP